MYPGPYRGTLERPVRDNPGGTRDMYPSPLAFWPGFSWDPAEFDDELREHDAIFEEEAPAMLFAARRDNPDTELRFLQLALLDSVTTVLGGGKTRLRMTDSRLGALHTGLPREFRRRLILSPRQPESYVVIITPQAASLRTAVLRVEAGPQGTVRSWLAPGRLLAVEPFRSRVRLVGPSHVVWWGSTPRSWLRVAVTRRPRFPHDPDVEMDRLVEGYRGELLEELGAATGHADPLGWIVSKRNVGDSVGVLERGRAEIADWVARTGVGEAAFRPAPPGWVPVVVQTDRHVGVRWLAVDAVKAKREKAPQGAKAVVVAWKRARGVGAEA